MATSFPTPPPSRLGYQSETSSQSHDLYTCNDRQMDKWVQEQEERRISQHDPVLYAAASRLVEQVLAKVVAEECMRIPSIVEEVCSIVQLSLVCLSMCMYM